MPDELEKIDKERLEETYDTHFAIDEILEEELEKIVKIASRIEAKIIALQHHRRINKDA